MNSNAEGIKPLFGPPVAAGLASWLVISLGFLGMKVLMQDRPEFVGQPLLASKVVAVQESPKIAVRSLRDDVSVIKFAQPLSSDVQVEMRGRRDYRGLKTISDMSGEVTARHLLTNRTDEPLFVLFKCPHPRSEGNDD